MTGRAGLTLAAALLASGCAVAKLPAAAARALASASPAAVGRPERRRGALGSGGARLRISPSAW